MTEKSVPRWRVEQIAKELNGEVHYQDLIDSKGRASKRIIITYREEDESSNLQ